MRKSLLTAHGIISFVFFTAVFHQAGAQSIRDYGLYAKRLVQLNTSTIVTGNGIIGSDSLVLTTGNATITGDINSWGRVELSNSNTIAGNIRAANTKGLPGYIFQTGSNAAITGNGYVKGSALMGGGFLTGTLTLVGTPGQYSYSGPNLGSRLVNDPSVIFPPVPDLPQSPTLTPGSVVPGKTVTPDVHYGDLVLTGNKTVTFAGPGDYFFNAIKNSGNFNNFVFDFNNTTEGVIRIFVLRHVDLYKLSITFPKGGGASRVYMEVQGDGSTSPDNVAWTISNGASGNNRSTWQGTVWAPNGSIYVGKGSSEAKILGALWSGKQITVQSGVSVAYVPLVKEEIIKPFNPTNVFKSYTVIGAILTSLTTGVTDEARKTLVIKGDSVLINVVAKIGHIAEVTDTVYKEGMRSFRNNGPDTLKITGMFPINHLLNLNDNGDIIRFCEPVPAPLPNLGQIRDAGDTAVGAFLARNGFDLKGRGVKVGVISDSYNTLKTNTNDPAQKDVEGGELPGTGNAAYPIPVDVSDYPYGILADEGRGMCQIIHALAPAAELAFASGFISPGDMAERIKKMTDDLHCNVIVDDVTFINAPFLQDGPVAKAVDYAKSKGVSYFSSAGNFSNKSYEATYNPVPAPSFFPAGTTAHNFSTSGSPDIYQKLVLKPGSYTVVLQWEDDIYSIGQTQNGGTQNDFDFYLTDANFNIICGYNKVNTGGDNMELFGYTVSNSVSQIEANILITRENLGTIAPRLKYIIFRGDALIAEYPAGASTIIGHANARGAIAVAAVNYYNTPAFKGGNTGSLAVANYSSFGGEKVGTPSGLEDRLKPDIAAPDGVNTSVNLGPDIALDPDNFSNFFGTSAAAPHAAAVAALLIEGRMKFKQEVLVADGVHPLVSPDTVKAIIQKSALAFGNPITAGAGLLQADSALRRFAAPKPKIDSLDYPSNITPENTTGSFTLTVNGQYLSTNTQIYIRNQAYPTTYVNSSQLTTTITNLVGNPYVKICTEGIAIGDGGCDSLQFFTVNKKLVRVQVRDTSKRYGEPVPLATTLCNITVNGVAVDPTDATAMQNIGLQSLTLQSNATALSDVGNQYTIKPVRRFDLTNVTDQALLETYTYDTIPGDLTILQLPVTVQANPQDLTYGQSLGPVTFTYTIDPTANITGAQATAVQNVIKTSHEQFLATDYVAVFNNTAAFSNLGLPVTISNGTIPVTISNNLPVTISNGSYVPIINPQSITTDANSIAYLTPGNLTASQVTNLSFLATSKAIQNARTVNGNMKVVDISQETFLKFLLDQKQTVLNNAVAGATAKGLLGTKPLINGLQVTISNGMLPVTISNGTIPVTISNATLPVTISNGQMPVTISNVAIPVTISNGTIPVTISNVAIPVTISNGAFPITISNSLIDPANNIGIILDSADAIASSVGLVQSVNALTGLTSGQQYLIPAVVLNDNFKFSYVPGSVNIHKATLTVKADNKTKAYLDANPPLTASLSGFKFGETPETSDTTGVPALSTTATQSSAMGNYPITVTQGTLNSNNYIFQFADGILTIGPNPCLLTRDPFSSFTSTPKPNTNTTLWLNIETKISGQLVNEGDSLVFRNGFITLNNISSTPAVTDLPVPEGKIIATYAVQAPVTTYDAGRNAWITYVPLPYSSTSDIFISGMAINSSKGFTKNNGGYSQLKGSFYSNRPTFSDQWTYAMACYRPTFTTATVGRVMPVNGDFRAGAPIDQTLGLIAGGTGGGGNNYTGSSTSYEKYSTCSTVASSITSNVVARIAPRETVEEVRSGGQQVTIMPNPASTKVKLAFTPSVSGNTRIRLISPDGAVLYQIFHGYSEKGMTYQRDLNTGGFAPGLYIIEWETGGKREFKKLIIAR